MSKDELFLSRLNIARGKMTRQTFAKVCGITPSTMRNYFEGKTEPRLTDLRQIAAAANTTVGWLVGDETPVPLPGGSLTATGNGNIQVGGKIGDGSTVSSGGHTTGGPENPEIGGNYILTNDEAEILTLDRQYGNVKVRKNYRQQLLQIRAIIEGE